MAPLIPEFAKYFCSYKQCRFQWLPKVTDLRPQQECTYCKSFFQLALKSGKSTWWALQSWSVTTFIHSIYSRSLGYFNSWTLFQQEACSIFQECVLQTPDTFWNAVYFNYKDHWYGLLPKKRDLSPADRRHLSALADTNSSSTAVTPSLLPWQSQWDLSEQEYRATPLHCNAL